MQTYCAALKNCLLFTVSAAAITITPTDFNGMAP